MAEQPTQAEQEAMDDWDTSDLAPQIKIIEDVREIAAGIGQQILLLGQYTTKFSGKVEGLAKGLGLSKAVGRLLDEEAKVLGKLEILEEAVRKAIEQNGDDQTTLGQQAKKGRKKK